MECWVVGLEALRIPITSSPDFARKSTAMPKAKNQKQPDDSGLNFEAQLWAAADKMRGHMDASEYKHVVLGLSFRTDLHPDLKADFILVTRLDW